MRKLPSVEATPPTNHIYLSHSHNLFNRERKHAQVLIGIFEPILLTSPFIACLMTLIL